MSPQQFGVMCGVVAHHGPAAGTPQGADTIAAAANDTVGPQVMQDDGPLAEGDRVGAFRPWAASRVAAWYAQRGMLKVTDPSAPKDTPNIERA